ncbi:hypothetical protein ABPG74_008881 [Tetrahymena malaccensis]
MNKLIYLSMAIIPILINGMSPESDSVQDKIFEIQLQYDSLDNSYYAILDMGNKVQQQNFKFLIDTGSENTFVQVKNCHTCLEKNKQKQIRECEQSNCQENQTSRINYGIGKIDVYETIDYLVFQDLQNGETFTLDVVMSHVTEVSKELMNKQLNGLIALQFKQDPSDNQDKNPFIFRFKKEGKIDDELVFSINFRKQDAALILGGVKTDLIPQNQTIQYVSKDDQNWVINLSNFEVGNSSILDQIQQPNPTNQTNLVEPDQKSISEKEDQFKAVIDSGSNIIALNQNQIENFKDILQNQYNITCMVQAFTQLNYSQLKCKNPDGRIDQYPPLRLTFIDQNGEDFVITIPPKNYVEEKVVDQSQTLSIISFLKNNIPNQIILGYPFLQNKYIVFDQRNKQIGFVQLEPLDYQMCSTQVMKYILVGLLIMYIGYSAARSIIKKIF